MQLKEALVASEARDWGGFARHMSEVSDQNTGIAAVGPTGGPLSALRGPKVAAAPLAVEADLASLADVRSQRSL